MKKLSTLLLLCMITIVSFAQVENAGKFGTEIYLNPWNNDGNTFSLINGVKFRYFTSNNLAIRGSLTLSSSPITTYEYGLDEYEREIKYKEKNSFTTFGFMPGIEYHVTTTKRTSVYVGGGNRL